MTEAALRLDNAPIVEAVVEINCDLPPSTDLERVQNAAKGRLLPGYPVARRQMTQSHELRQEGEKPVEFSVRRNVSALHFLTSDQKQIIQFRPEGYTFNRLAPYSSLDDYLPEIERTWRIFCELVEPIQIRRIGLRFINRLPVPTSNGRLELGDYLEVSPRLPDEEALEFVGFFNQHSAVEPATGNQVNITLVMQPLEGDKLPLIFDIDAFRMITAPPDDWALIRATVGSLRVLKNRVFERTLTESCLNLFRQQL